MPDGMPIPTAGSIVVSQRTAPTSFPNVLAKDTQDHAPILISGGMSLGHGCKLIHGLTQMTGRDLH